MNSNCRIAMEQKDGTYKSIYCHHDGDLFGVGKTLYENYRDPIKVELMLNLGDLSSLKEYVYPDTNKLHNFDNPQCDVCVSYYRDRGESLHYNIFPSKDELLDYSCKSDDKYLYIFENEKWLVTNTTNKKLDEIELEDLEQRLYEYDIIDEPYSNYEYYTDELANCLVNYYKDFDDYDFNDNYDSTQEAFDIIKKDLDKGKGIDSHIRVLCENIENSALESDLSDLEVEKLNNKAFGLIKELNQYIKVLEKNKDKEMDIQ